ncbi:MAG: phasin family protein [Gammaproteobacteria bacterium]|nr:phasin family protein [Gammaproteobacteria bacterium]
MPAKKKATKSGSIVGRFEGTVIEKPIVIANKTFLAGLGLATQLQSTFDKKFDELAKDGAKVRQDAKKSANSLRGDIESRFTSVRKNLTKRIETAVETVLDYSPVATTEDVEKLNKKLDKVLVRVAK